MSFPDRAPVAARCSALGRMQQAVADPVVGLACGRRLRLAAPEALHANPRTVRADLERA